jgi:sugar lactone lactonase YvrE
MNKFASILGTVALATLIALPAVVAGDAPRADQIPQRTARTIATFDTVNGTPGIPEGITTDGAHGLYVSLFALDEIWHVDPATGDKHKVADVPGGGVKGDLVGLERDPSDGTILAAFNDVEGADLFQADHPNCRDPKNTTSGIYRVDPKTGTVTPFATRGMGVPICFPDDIAIDANSNVYVTDLLLGVIWKFDRQGHGAIWSDDPLLGWTEQSATWNARYDAPWAYLGVNTVALSPDGKTLFAGTDGGPGLATGGGLLVRIPINDDGSAGKPDLFASGMGNNDGLEVGPDGTIYFADTVNSDIWAFSAEGNRRLLVASRDELGDPLDNATSLVYLDGCLYNTELGFFQLQAGKPEDTLRNVVQICNFGNPAVNGTYTPPPVRTVVPPNPLPQSARPTHPQLSTVRS